MTKYRYYCRMRPPMPGSIPRGVIGLEDFGERRHVYEAGCEAWGWVEYERKLTEREIYDYELVPDRFDNIIEK